MANPPPEYTEAVADMAKDGMVPLDASPLVADHGSSAVGDGDEVMVEAFEAAPQPRAESEGGAFPGRRCSAQASGRATLIGGRTG